MYRKFWLSLKNISLLGIVIEFSPINVLRQQITTVFDIVITVCDSYDQVL